MYAGQILKALCMIPNPQIFKLILFLNIIKVKKNPPKQKNTSTDRSPASTIKK